MWRTFDSKLGAMSGYVWRGDELLAAPMRPDFWRAPLDNDRGAQLPRKLRKWRSAGESFEVAKTEVKKPEPHSDGTKPAEACIKFTGKLTEVGDADYSDRLHRRRHRPGHGRNRLQATEPPRRADAASLRHEWILDGSLNQITWYGRGPEPTYSDRKQAPLGVYSSSVADQFVRYFRPQENSNKVDVRWVAVTNPSAESAC